MTVEVQPGLGYLAREVSARRHILGLTRDNLQERGGPSDSTVARIESPTPTTSYPRPTTLRRLDSGLRWKPGSAAGCLGLYPPVSIEDSATTSGPLDDVESSEPNEAVVQEFASVAVPVSVLREGLNVIQQAATSAVPAADSLVRLSQELASAHCTEVLERFRVTGKPPPQFLMTTFAVYLAKQPIMKAPTPQQHAEQRYRRWLVDTDTDPDGQFLERFGRKRTAIALGAV